MENGNVSVLVAFEEVEINLKIRTGFEWRIWSGISCTLLYIKKCLWVGSFGVKWHESPFISKHLKGQLDPPVSDGHIFGSKVVSWISLLVTVTFLDQRWSAGSPC